MRLVPFSLRSRRRSRSRTPTRYCCAATRPFNRVGGARRLRRRAPRRLRRSCLFAADADADMGGADDRSGSTVPFDESGRVASRPGFPAEPAARSRPCGRVSLASPLASLAARSPCPAVRCAHRRVLLAPAFAVANAAWLPLRRVSSAQAPRPLPFGSVPGTAFPFVRYPGSGPLDALRRLGSHTGRTSGCRCPISTLEYSGPTVDYA